jgi:hypothetical protein
MLKNGQLSYQFLGIGVQILCFANNEAQPQILLAPNIEPEGHEALQSANKQDTSQIF